VSAVIADRPGAIADGPRRSVQLVIGGMTCASCAARIEKKLSKLDGVTATVKLATETARVSFPAAVSPEELIAAVTRAGYTATLPPVPQADSAERVAGTTRPAGQPDEMTVLRRRLLVSVALAVPVVVLAMVPARPDPDGVSTFRTSEIRPGWVPARPRGRRCSPGQMPCPAVACRFPAASPCTPLPHPIAGLLFTRHQRRFTRFTRPACPWPVVPGRDGNPQAFPCAPHPAVTGSARQDGAGREHAPGTTRPT